MSIAVKVQDIFRDVFDNPDLVIGEKTSANDIEDWDSLAQVNLIVAMEKEFGIKFTIAEVEPLQNVGDMISLIGRKVAD